MKIKKNDTVLITTGKDKGKQSKVLYCNASNNCVIVDNINMQKKCMKKRSNDDVSKIIEKPGFINVSNTMLICTKCNKPTRICYEKDENNHKHRKCKKCNEYID